MKTRGNNLKIWLLVLYLGLVGAAKALNLSSDYLWFEHLGFEQIFWRTLLSKVFTATVFGLSFFLILFINLQFVRPGENEVLEWKYYSNKSQTAKSIPLRPQTYDGFILFGSAAGGIIMGLISIPFWKQVLQFLYASDTGILEPVFGRDVSFYLFKLPFYDFFFKWSLIAWLIVFLSVAVFYYREGCFDKSRELPYERNRRHLGFLAGILFLILAGLAGAEIHNFLFLNKAPAVSGNYLLNIKNKLSALKITTVLLLCGAGAGLFLNRKLTFRRLGIIGGIILLQHLGMFYIYPRLTLSGVRNKNSYLDAFINNKTEATLYAYGLDKIKHREFNHSIKPKGKSSPGKGPVHPGLQNMQLWNRKTLLSNFNELQKIRSFYNFSTLTTDRYPINRKLTKTALSPRELVSARLGRESQDWSDLHLKYTHGYGAVLSPVNTADKQKLPQFIVGDIPLKKPVNLEIKRPEIYYGMETNDYCLVKADFPEYNYPQSNGYRYQGNGGVPIKSFIKRLIFAWNFSDWEIIRSAHLTGNTRLMFNRNINDRINAITPFLHYDKSPDLVISNGKLYWLVNIYTITDHFPNSSFTEENKLNYIRNSAVAVIDAYNGKVDYYMVEGNDPLLNIWSEIFPWLFKPIDKMPDGIKKHMKYPKKLFEIQMGIYQKFHFNGPKPLPGGSKSAGSLKFSPSFYRIARKRDGRMGFFLFSLLEHPEKKVFVSQVKAGCDPDNYGEITVEKFPLNRFPPNIAAVEMQIKKDKKIQENLQKLKEKESNLVFGKWQSIWYEDEFLYIQPIYSIASNSELSKLRRIRAVYKDRLAMESDFKKALDAVLIDYTDQPATIDGLLKYQEWSRQARQHLRKSRKALMKADWNTYVNEMNELEQILKKMNK